MNVVLGFKAHSGWAALVVVGKGVDGLEIVHRRRVELVEEEWARQPYHAAENQKGTAARDLVKQGIDSAHRIALRELRAEVASQKKRKNQVLACAIVVGNPMAAWTVDEILAVHLRMHQAEGVLFREALLRAAGKCGLRAVAIPEKQLVSQAGQALKVSTEGVTEKIKALGKIAGPPWGKDQKEACLAAMIAME